MSRIPNLSRLTAVSSRASSSIAGRVILGASVLSALLGAKSYLDSFGAQKEIDFRKNQLQQPVYKLTEQQMVNPPWNHENLDFWLYRRVEVVGRPIIGSAMNISNRQFDQVGFEEVVPLVTREDKQYQNRQGLLLSLGWVPESVRHPTCRHRIERVDRQKFVGFVSKLSELRNNTLFQGNAYQQGRLYFKSSDLEDMGKACKLLNKNEASVAVIERLAETGIFDQRSSYRRGVDASFTEPYPWAKTEAGALQLDKMPWELRTEAGNYFLASLVGFFVGASVF